jgi:GNAT superfamily N-acetyltransferase
MNSRAFDRCGCPSFIPPFSLRSGGSGPRRCSLISRLYSEEMPYLVREATLDDADALVRHRVGMFTDMGEAFDPAALESSYREWLAAMMPAGTYRSWLVEHDGVIVAGGGITVLPWPPSPRNLGHRIAFVYNVYTERAHRRRGLARLIMDRAHQWCAANGIHTVALHASSDGRPLYEDMGYIPWPTPMMFLPIVRV